jgi:cvfA/B/C family virulence factor
VATYRIVAWQQIPASVEARDADGEATVALSERFQMLIDALAMQLGLDDDTYLDQWQRLDAVERPGAARDVAAAVAAELEERFPEYSAHPQR